MDVRFETKFNGKAGSDEWLTPPEIIKILGPFDLDPCFSTSRPWDTAKKHYGLPDNGLCLPWEGFVWCNPPYGKESVKWLEKMAFYQNGLILIFARTETKMFERYIWKKARAILFIYGRLRFHDKEGNRKSSAGAPSCVIAYNEEGINRLKKAEKYNYGKLIFIDKTRVI